MNIKDGVKLFKDEKPFKFYTTDGFDAKYGGFETYLYVQMVLSLLREYPFDMFIFTTKDGKMEIDVDGYCIVNTDKHWKGKYVHMRSIKSVESLDTEKFWAKIDEYEDCFRVTFLFPHEY